MVRGVPEKILSFPLFAFMEEAESEKSGGYPDVHTALSSLPFSTPAHTLSHACTHARTHAHCLFKHVGILVRRVF